MTAPIVLGAALGSVLVLLAGQHGSAPARTLALGLLVAALIYLGFALAAPSLHRLPLEAAGVALFAALAWLGVRRSLWWLVLGWVAHVAWDVGLHLDRPQDVVGPWYPLLCVGFDLVVAGYLLGPAAAAVPEVRR